MARVMVTIPDDFLRKVDEAARGEHMKRSELFRDALRKWMAERESHEGRTSRRERSLQALEEMRQFREAHPPIPGTPSTVDLIRQMRGPI